MKTNNRFEEVFKLFEQEFSSFLEEFKRQDLVFCCTFDPEGDGCHFQVFENRKAYCHLQGAVFKSTEIKVRPGHDLIYHDKVWFFYEDSQEIRLEAMMSFIDGYMPDYYIRANEPVMSYHSKSFPSVPGIRQAKQPVQNQLFEIN